MQLSFDGQAKSRLFFLVADSQSYQHGNTAGRRRRNRMATNPGVSIARLHVRSDGRYLWSGCQDGSLLRWDIDPQSWIERLCQLAGRNLTESEWALFFREVPYRETCE